MNGGVLIATGSSSCVISPNIPCKKNGSVKKNMVSKIIYSEDAKNESLTEKKMNAKIKKIKGYASWSVVFDEFCEPFDQEILEEYDKEGIRDCLNEEEEMFLVEDFDQNSYMMNGLYGGITLDRYFEDSFDYIENSTAFTNKFYDLMVRMEPLFFGLKKMNEKGIVHNDIKYNNIVLHNGVFKYIDFVLSGMKSNKSHFKERSLNELNTNRIYLFYPLDYLLFYASQNKLTEELTNIYNHQPRKNYDHLNQVNILFGSDGLIAYEETTSELKRKTVTEKKMIESIDVYSLGVIIPLLFLFHTQLNDYNNPSELFRNVVNHNELVKDFFILFGEMINPSSNNRISAHNASLRFKRLVKKYTPNKKPKKKPKKKMIQKSVKRRKPISRKKPIGRRKLISRKKPISRRKLISRKKPIGRRGRGNISPIIYERVNMPREAY